MVRRTLPSFCGGPGALGVFVIVAVDMDAAMFGLEPNALFGVAPIEEEDTFRLGVPRLLR